MPFSSFFVVCHAADDMQTKRYLISLERNLQIEITKKDATNFLDINRNKNFNVNARIELNRTKVEYARYNVINYTTSSVSLERRNCSLHGKPLI
jgi:phosphorylcholine metabolism protein LicD